MRIGELSERTGIPRRMLRYYEETGMLVPGRCENGYRDYDERSVDRALQIRGLLDAGVPTRVIKQLLPCLKRPGVALVFDATPETLAILERERDSMSERIDTLTRSRDAIARYIETVRGLRTPDADRTGSSVELVKGAR